jgi:hypothetical protein
MRGDSQDLITPADRTTLLHGASIPRLAAAHGLRLA